MPSDRNAEARPTRAELHREVKRLARAFTDGLLAVLDEHLDAREGDAVTSTDSRNRRKRRGDDALGAVGVRVLALLEREGGPLSIGDMARDLDVDRSELAHPLKRLVDDGRLAQVGARRGVKYKIAKRGQRRSRVSSTHAADDGRGSPTAAPSRGRREPT